MQLILPILMHCIVCILINYSFDRPSLPDNSKALSMPSVRDLSEDSSLYEIDTYVQKEIIPAHDYFLELKESELTDRSPAFILYLASFLYILFSVDIVISEIDFFNNIRLLCCICDIVISITICLSLWWILSKIYRKWFAIGDFNLTTDQIIMGIPEYEKSLKISKDRYIENQFIDIYHDHIKCNRDKTRRRCFVYKIIYIVAAVLALLFFIQVGIPMQS